MGANVFILSHMVLLVAPVTSDLIVGRSVDAASKLSFLVLSRGSSPSFTRGVARVFLLYGVLEFSYMGSRTSSIAVDFVLLFVIVSPDGFYYAGVAAG